MKTLNTFITTSVLFSRRLLMGERRENWHLAMLILFICLSVICFTFPTFRKLSNISNFLAQMTPLAIVSIGQCYVITSAGIDLSVGSLVSLSTLIAANTIQDNLVGILQAVVLVLIVAAVIGVINATGKLVLGIDPFIMTLAMMVIIQGLTFFISLGPSGAIPPAYANFMYGRIGFVPIGFLLYLTILVTAGLFLYRRRIGYHVYALGGDENVAHLAGINISKVVIVVYVVCSGMAGIAGLVLSARIYCGHPLVGAPLALDSIAAVVLGGTPLTGGRGGLIGTAIGVIIISLLNNMLNLLGVTVYPQYIVKAFLLIGVCGLSYLTSK